MLTLISDEQASLAYWGERLRERRLARNEHQTVFAARLGVSPTTYRKMENGDPSVAVGYWIRAMRLFGALDQIDNLLPTPMLASVRVRRRAPKRGSSG